MEVPAGVRLLAHELFALSPIGPNIERVVGERYVMHVGPTPIAGQNNVMRICLGADEVETAVEDVRAFFCSRQRTRVTWWVSPASTPADLVQRLRRLGMHPNDEPPLEPRSTAMAILSPPRVGPPDVVARVAQTFDEYHLAADIVRAASGMEPSDAAAVERQRRAYEELHLAGKFVAYVARIDGKPAAAAAAAFCTDAVTLGGAGTLPELRGRGAYTALVRARWNDAVERGTSALVVQAGAMSRPILERLGFQSLGDVDVLLDDFSNSRAS